MSYNSLCCLTLTALIAFSSLVVNFLVGIFTSLHNHQLTKQLTSFNLRRYSKPHYDKCNQAFEADVMLGRLNVVFFFFRLISIHDFVSLAAVMSYFFILGFVLFFLHSISSCLSSTQTSHHSHDLIVMFPLHSSWTPPFPFDTETNSTAFTCFCDITHYHWPFGQTSVLELEEVGFVGTM